MPIAEIFSGNLSQFQTHTIIYKGLLSGELIIDGLFYGVINKFSLFDWQVLKNCREICENTFIHVIERPLQDLGCKNLRNTVSEVFCNVFFAWLIFSLR